MLKQNSKKQHTDINRLRYCMRFLLFTALSVCCLFILQPIKAFAAPPLVVDEAGVLSDAQVNSLTDTLTALSDKYDIDVAVYTVKTLDGRDSLDVADDHFYYDGYGTGSERSGILLLHCPAERDYAITTSGTAREKISTDRLDLILDDLVSDMRNGVNSGNYLPAYQRYASLVDEAMRSNVSKVLETMGGSAILAPIIGFISSFIYMGGQKKKLQSVRRQRSAAAYVSGYGPQVRVSRDLLVNRTVNRVPIRRESNDRPSSHSSGSRPASVHTHSSGHTFSGGGRKY